MQKIKVLIADDSVVYRSQIRAALTMIPNVEVVTAVSNGRMAIDILLKNKVDLLILDLEMPEMDGIQTLTEMNLLSITCNVLVFSSASKRGAEITFEALRLGAKDFVTKPGAAMLAEMAGSDPASKILALFEPKFRMMFPSNKQSSAPASAKPISPPANYPHLIWDLHRPQVIVIGASTGGPTVLEKIFSELHGELNLPILIAQHMPAIFTASLAERLAKLSGLRVKEGEHGEALQAKTVYIAPGNFHMTLAGTVELSMIRLDQSPLINFVRPAVDPLFESVARIYKEKTLGIILTGMGADGKVGCQTVKTCAGGVAIQDQESCVVFGMPGAVFEANAYDKILNPQEIIRLLKDKAFGFSIQGEIKNA